MIVTLRTEIITEIAQLLALRIILLFMIAKCMEFIQCIICVFCLLQTLTLEPTPVELARMCARTCAYDCKDRFENYPRISIYSFRALSHQLRFRLKDS